MTKSVILAVVLLLASTAALADTRPCKEKVEEALRERARATTGGSEEKPLHPYQQYILLEFELCRETAPARETEMVGYSKWLPSVKEKPTPLPWSNQRRQKLR